MSVKPSEYQDPIGHLVIWSVSAAVLVLVAIGALALFMEMLGYEGVKWYLGNPGVVVAVAMLSQFILISTGHAPQSLKTDFWRSG